MEAETLKRGCLSSLTALSCQKLRLLVFSLAITLLLTVMQLYGQWAMDRGEKRRCGSAEGNYRAGGEGAREARREPVIKKLTTEDALRCQSALRSVADAERIVLTMVMESATIAFIWIVSFVIGVYAATHQYQIGDYVASFVGFVGLAVPNFLLALVLLYVGKVYFGLSIGGLMDPEFIDKPFSWAKFVSVAQHLVIPVIVIGTSGTAGMIRRLRANLLDELQKQYVITGRAKGLPPLKLLIKYPLRHAINPFVADIGHLLPEVISGSVIVSVVLSLPTTGPMLLGALKTQDVNLAATFLLIVAVLTVIGMLISDLLLAVLDPRIRFGATSEK